MTGAGSGIPLAPTPEKLAELLRPLRATGRRVGFVPTMGALHPGHLSLVDRAAALSDLVVVSIFVNPLQFGRGEDLSRYPRDLAGDLERLGGRGVGLVFAPSVDGMFGGGSPGTRVTPGPLGDRLCGPFRPGHFEGVLTVVARLFGLVRPETAVFGRKDLQQAVLIRRMVEDLALGVRVEIAPLVREPDGLAMSSRNAYLSLPEREEALGLSRALVGADTRFRAGESRVAELLREARRVLAEHRGLAVEYVEVVDADRLEPLQEATAGAVMAAAVRCGGTRLIDNVVLGSAEPDPRIALNDA